MAIQFRKERADEIWDEAMTLMQLHHEAISRFRDLPLDPSRKLHKELEDAQIARTFTAREDGVLIGYAAFFVSPSAHYQTVLQAVQHALFIHPDKRGFGSRFIDWCDDQMKAAGVKAVFHFVNVEHDFSSALTRLGYERVETVYLRRL